MALTKQEKIIIQNLEQRFSYLASKIDSSVEVEDLSALKVPTKLKERGRANVDAMKLATGYETPNLDAEQIKKIKLYTGWGGFRIVETAGKEKESVQYWIRQYNNETQQDIQVVDSDADISKGDIDKTSTTYEYYTPYWLTSEIARLIKPLESNFKKKDGKYIALETSAGVGRFLQPYSPSKFQFYAVEPSLFSYEILSRSYPQARTFQQYFEEFITSATGQDLIGQTSLVVSNPPYGTRDANMMLLDPSYQRITTLVPYFILRSMSLLHEDGIGVFLVTSGFMDSADNKKIRTELIKSNHLLGALRLPSTQIVPKKRGEGTTKKPAIFEGTQIIVDLIFMQRRKGELKAIPSADKSFVDGGYFTKNPKNVIGEYEQGYREELVIDKPLTKLPKITFKPMKKYAESAYKKFKEKGSKGTIIDIPKDTSRLTQDQRTAIKFGNLSSDYLSSLDTNKLYAKKIQDQIKQSLTNFLSVYKTQKDVNSLIKGLSKAGFDAESAKIKIGYESRDKITKKISVTITFNTQQKKDAIFVANALLDYRATMMHKPYMYTTLSQIEKYMGTRKSLPILDVLAVNEEQFGFLYQNNGEIEIYRGNEFFSGIVWGNYDGTKESIEDIKKIKTLDSKLQDKLLDIFNKQLQSLEESLNLINESYLVKFNKATPKDSWIPTDILYAFFHQVFYLNSYDARNINSGARKKYRLTPDWFTFFRDEENKELYLKVESSNLFMDRYDGKFLEAKKDWFYIQKSMMDADKIKIKDDLSGYRLEYAENAYKTSKNRIKMIFDEYQKEAFDEKGEFKPKGDNKRVQKLALATQNLYRAMRSAFILNDEYFTWTGNSYEEFEDIFIPVRSLKDGDLFDEQRVALGWMTGLKALFSPSWSASKENNNEHTKINADEDKDKARLRLDQKWMKLWSKWLKTQPQVVEKLTDIYNRIFRGYNAKELNGSPIKILGWNSDIVLRPYQNSAVRKLVDDRGGLLALDVGLGKTFSGIATIGLMKQQGRAKRPIIVVPKTLLFQWKKQINICFPDYVVEILGQSQRYTKSGRLITSTDNQKVRTEKWIKFANGFYDILICSYEKIMITKVQPSTFNSYVDKALMFNAPPPPKANDQLSQKQYLNQIKKIKSKLVKDIAPAKNTRIDDVSWEDLGVDFIMVDEAQNFKNLWVPQVEFSKTPKYLGLGKGSTRAYQLDMRSKYIRENNNGSVVLLSATPAKNSPIEFYNLIQYFTDDAFRAYPTPTDFFNRFLVTRIKRLPTTSLSTEMMPYIAGFRNVDEFRALLGRFAMFETLETVLKKYGAEYPDLREKLQIPETETEIVTLEPTEDQDADLEQIILAGDTETAHQTIYWPLIQKRNEQRIKESKDPENTDTIDKLIALEVLLRLTSVALHPILNKIEVKDDEEDIIIDEDAPKTKQKKEQLNQEQYIELLKFGTDAQLETKKIKLNYPKFKACADNVMTDIAEGGCGHIIFVENVLAHYIMKRILIKRGIKPERIAILSGLETKKADERSQVAEEFNGKVLLYIYDGKQYIESDFMKLAKSLGLSKKQIEETETREIQRYDVVIANSVAYEGIDLQKRTCMIHHLDMGWEPATIQQRNGRGVRQGNRYSLLKIFYYILSKSADTYRLKTIQEKRNWLVQAVESQDQKTNTIITKGDDGDLDDFLIKTLRDPEQFEAEIKAMRELKAKEDLKELRREKANEISDIRDAYAYANYFKSMNQMEKYNRQLKDADKLLEEFKSSTDANVYPFVEVVDMAKNHDVRVIERSPFGGVIFQTMTWSISIGNLPTIYAYAKKANDNDLRVEYRWVENDGSQNSTSSSENNTDQFGLQSALRIKFERFLKELYPNEDREGIIAIQEKDDTAIKYLIDEKALNLIQTQKVKDNMRLQTYVGSTDISNVENNVVGLNVNPNQRFVLTEFVSLKRKIMKDIKGLSLRDVLLKDARERVIQGLYSTHEQSYSSWGSYSKADLFSLSLDPKTDPYVIYAMKSLFTDSSSFPVINVFDDQMYIIRRTNIRTSGISFPIIKDKSFIQSVKELDISFELYERDTDQGDYRLEVKVGTGKKDTFSLMTKYTSKMSDKDLILEIDKLLKTKDKQPKGGYELDLKNSKVRIAKNEKKSKIITLVYIREIEDTFTGEKKKETIEKNVIPFFIKPILPDKDGARKFIEYIYKGKFGTSLSKAMAFGSFIEDNQMKITMLKLDSKKYPKETEDLMTALKSKLGDITPKKIENILSNYFKEPIPIEYTNWYNEIKLKIEEP